MSSRLKEKATVVFFSIPIQIVKHRTIWNRPEIGCTHLSRAAILKAAFCGGIHGLIYPFRGCMVRESCHVEPRLSLAWHVLHGTIHTTLEDPCGPSGCMCVRVCPVGGSKTLLAFATLVTIAVGGLFKVTSFSVKVLKEGEGLHGMKLVKGMRKLSRVQDFREQTQIFTSSLFPHYLSFRWIE